MGDTLIVVPLEEGTEPSDLSSLIYQNVIRRARKQTAISNAKHSSVHFRTYRCNAGAVAYVSARSSCKAMSAAAC